MIAHFSELDGTTFHLDIPDARPEWLMPVRPICIGIFEEQDLSKPVMTVNRYRLIGVSGEIAFYDRVVDVETIR